jgi:hypothetical protein
MRTASRSGLEEGIEAIAAQLVPFDRYERRALSRRKFNSSMKSFAAQRRECGGKARCWARSSRRWNRASRLWGVIGSRFYSSAMSMAKSRGRQRNRYPAHLQRRAIIDSERLGQGGRLGCGSRIADSCPVIGRADEFDAGCLQNCPDASQRLCAARRHTINAFKTLNCRKTHTIIMGPDEAPLIRL